MFPGSRLKPLLFGVLAILIGAGLVFMMMRSTPPVPVRFHVQKGESVHEIAKDLHDNGLIGEPWVFLVWEKLLGSKAIRPGVYELSPRDSSFHIYRTLLRGPQLVRVTFPEGWTAKQMASLLDARGITASADFLAIVAKEKREGYLFPDTYFFEQALPAQAVVARLVARFKEKVPKDFATQAKALKLSYGQLVTMASIVEWEAQASQERPIIAGVFFNRLRKHWHLESCATVEYALGARKSHLNYKDLDVKSPYNTYRHPGLPPGPICNPGAAALEAAAHPAQTDMMFFVADGHGTHSFSRFYNEHLAVQGVRGTKAEGGGKTQ